MTIKQLTDWIAYARKAIINGIGLATSLLSLGLLPEPYAKYVAAAVAVATVIVHYRTANDQAVPSSFVPSPPKAITAPAERLDTVEGEIVEPQTAPIPVVTDDTVGIPLVEGETQAPQPVSVPMGPLTTVEDIIDRLKSEGTLSAAW